jgi:hypothetical protein
VERDGQGGNLLRRTSPPNWARPAGKRRESLSIAEPPLHHARTIAQGQGSGWSFRPSYKHRYGVSDTFPSMRAVVAAAGWESRLKERLSEFQSCKEKSDDLSPCNRFTGRALEEVYGVEDFKDPTHAGQYLSANLIEAYVATSANWVFLGGANEQKALNEAALAANQGRAVIAVRMGEQHGHVAIILPGQLTKSSSWNLDVPNSACFFLGKPSESYVVGPLSKAFGVPNGVKLFARTS